jgi:hypothetical protein
LFVFMLPAVCLGQPGLIGTPVPAAREATAGTGTDGADPQAILPTALIVFPHLAIGGPWKTILVLVNYGDSSVKGILKVFSSSGNAMTVSLSDGSRVFRNSRFEFSLAARQSLFLETVELPAATQTGYATLDTVGPNLTGYAIFRASLPGRPDLEAVVPGDSSFIKGTLIFDNTRDFVTSVAIASANLNSLSDTGELIAEVHSFDGTLLATYRRTVRRGEHFAFETNREWPATANRRGTIKLTINGLMGCGSLALLFNPSGAVTSAPLIGEY